MIAKYVDYRTLALIFCGTTIPFVILMFLVPESPVYLVSRRKMKSAQAQLRRLRGTQWDILKETQEISKSVLGKNPEESEKKTSIIHEFFKPDTIKPLIIAILLMFFFQCSGINLIMIFAPQIFADVTNIDKFLASIMFGGALFTSNVLTLIIAGKCPRRIMLIISSLGCAVTLAVMGLSYQITDWEKQCNETTFNNNTLNLTQSEVTALCSYNVTWLPVVTSMIFIFVFNLGYGSLVWITAVEILPANIRTLTNG